MNTKKIIPIVEIVCGVVVTVGIGGMVSWLANESMALRSVRAEIATELQSYKESANHYAQKQLELSNDYENKRKELFNTYTQKEGEYQAKLDEQSVKQDEYQSKLNQLEATIQKLNNMQKEVVSLHNKFKEFEVVEKSVAGRQEKVIVRGAGNVFINEDFSNYRLGDIPPDWGQGLTVTGNEMNYLHGTSTSPGILRKEINFPQSFSFKFNFWYIYGGSGLHDWKITLQDARGKTISVRTVKNGVTKVQLDGAQAVTMGSLGKNSVIKKKWYSFEFEVQEQIIRFYVDRKFISSAKLEGYTNFVRFLITAEPWNHLSVDDIYGVDLGEEVKPVGGK